jgi:serine protease Do
MNRLASLLFLWFFTTFAVAQTRGLPDFSELAERQGPAVVNISTTQVIRGQAQMMPFPFDESDPAFEFFKRFPRTPGVESRVISRTSRWVPASLSAATATS